jgi:hypothetical protein
MTTTDFYIGTRPVQPGQGQKERPRVATRQPPSKRAKVEKEPEARLWKVCAEVASLRLSGFERTAFLLLGASALGALVSCFSEFFHLLSSGGLDDTVRALLAK